MTSGNPPQSRKPAWAQQQSLMPCGSAQASGIMSLTVLPCVGLWLRTGEGGTALLCLAGERSTPLTGWMGRSSPGRAVASQCCEPHCPGPLLAYYPYRPVL